MKSVSQHLDAIIPKGRNIWKVVDRSEEVYTGLEGADIRGRSIEMSSRYPGGTRVRVMGVPL